MTSTDIPLPPAHTVQAALHKVTETLASELARPTESTPSWSEFEWRIARAAAAMHGVAPLLSSRLRWRGPADWGQFLALQRAHTLGRQRRIEQLLGAIDTRAQDAGLPVVALKGAALHALGLYTAGERPMADVDLLVRSADVERAARMLQALRFHESGATWKHRSFDPDGAAAHTTLGEHADNAIKVDLHTKVAERLPLPETSFSDLVLPQRLLPGLNNYPSLASLMLHVLAHAAGTMVHRGLRLIQLVDMVRVAARMTNRDWGQLLDCRGDDHRLWWAPAPLMISARYFPSAVPSAVIAALLPDCPWLLRKVCGRRTLSEVSYSHAFIDPIPGIVWTRSVGEMLRYLVSRVRPSSEQLAQLNLLARTYPWAAEPQWYEQSQVRRILHWLTSRPTRAETMQPVRAALGARH